LSSKENRLKLDYEEEVIREEDRIPPIKSKTFIDKPNEKSILKDDNWERCEKKGKRR
jgi:hypothetical protein